MKYWPGILTCLMVCGCVNTASYYQLNPDKGWSQYHSSCAGLLSSYVRKFESGEKLTLSLYRNAGTRLYIVFLVPKGKAVQLSRPDMIAKVDGVSAAVPIKEFVSERDLSGYDLTGRPDLKKFQVPRLTLNATSPLLGLGRFSESPRGESMDDRYVATVTLSNQSLDAFAIRLPTVVIDGVTYDIGELSFKYTSSNYLQCFQ